MKHHVISHHVGGIAAGLALVLGSASLARASVDTSSKPGGVYRLKPGIYVAKGSRCESPANAAIRQYDGKGISTAHTSSCRAVVRDQKRSSYTVDQTCIDAGHGSGKRFVQRQQVVVQDALTFTQVIGKGRTTYQYCPEYQLPKDLRRAL